MKPIGKGSSFLVWGSATKDARTFVLSSGKHKTTFSIVYNRTKDEDGNKVSEYLDVEAWESLADYAAGIEKGDTLLIGGQYMRDDYRSEKKGEEIWKLVAGVILVQPTAAYEEDYEEPEEPEAREDDPPTPAPAPEPPPESTKFRELMDEAEGELPF